ncbi:MULTISPECIES: hypothetical protein [Burkholderiaceae]|uniref:hypothetical protein n=1 Tax=Burkholderiaceae TaxID=119060 RepID=UPI00097652A3|nr:MULTISPECIES: hypothetical protein [Burkholderiaceae]MCF2133650.1 hypothetical protein [Mycetohabitans sp. B3]
MKRYALENGAHRLIWPTQTMAECTTAADVDTQGQFIAVQQRLQNSEFYQEQQPDEWTKQRVLVYFGKPAEDRVLVR